MIEDEKLKNNLVLLFRHRNMILEYSIEICRRFKIVLIHFHVQTQVEPERLFFNCKHY